MRLCKLERRCRTILMILLLCLGVVTWASAVPGQPPFLMQVYMFLWLQIVLGIVVVILVHDKVDPAAIWRREHHRSAIVQSLVRDHFRREHSRRKRAWKRERLEMKRLKRERLEREYSERVRMDRERSDRN